jgi:Mrp family chromosome partitioning ATPase
LAKPRCIDLAELPVVPQLLEGLERPLADLARRVRRMGPLDGGSIVLLAGCRRGVGCSTVALALAAAAAAERRVLLLDGDLDRAGLSTLLCGACRGAGWEAYVHGGQITEPVLAAVDCADMLTFLPLGGPAVDPQQFVNEPAVAELLAQWRGDYGLTVIDAGTVGDSGSLWGPATDAVLLVCDSSQPEDWGESWDRLEGSGAQVLGIVETALQS